MVADHLRSANEFLDWRSPPRRRPSPQPGAYRGWASTRRLKFFWAVFGRRLQKGTTMGPSSFSTGRSSRSRDSTILVRSGLASKVTRKTSDRKGPSSEVAATVCGGSHEGSIDFSGSYYQVRDCGLLPRIARPGRPPLLVGSTGERMLRAALPHADAWNAWYTDTANRADGARSQSQRVDALCIEVGRGSGSVERTVPVLVRPTFEGRPPGTSLMMGSSR